MGFTRSPVLKPEIEVQLATEMKPLYESGLSAKQITAILQFGEKGTIYEKLELYHIYFFRSKFNKGKQGKSTEHLAPFKGEFPPRKWRGGSKTGQHRYKDKKKKVMFWQEFKQKLNAELPDSNWHTRRKRSFLILSYWVPLRKSELYDRVIDNFKITGVPGNGFLTIDLYRKKKYYARNEKGEITAETEPIDIPRKMPLLEEVIDWVFKKDKFGNEAWRLPNNPTNRPWRISCTTALNWIKEALGEDYYNHYLRFNYITKAVEKSKDPPGPLLLKLRKKTGLNTQTLEFYIMANPKYRTSIDEREIEDLELEGEI